MKKEERLKIEEERKKEEMKRRRKKKKMEKGRRSLADLLLCPLYPGA